MATGSVGWQHLSFSLTRDMQEKTVWSADWSKLSTCHLQAVGALLFWNGPQDIYCVLLQVFHNPGSASRLPEMQLWGGEESHMCIS